MEGVEVIDEHLAGLAKSVSHVKIKDVTDTIKYKGVVVQHVVLLSYISGNRRLRGVRLFCFPLQAALS